jgi:hypothetical protein
MGSGQAPPVDCRSSAAEDSLSIPPPSAVRLTESTDGSAKPEKAFKIYVHDMMGS